MASFKMTVAEFESLANAVPAEFEYRGVGEDDGLYYQGVGTGQHVMWREPYSEYIYFLYVSKRTKKTIRVGDRIFRFSEVIQQGDDEPTYGYKCKGMFIWEWMSANNVKALLAMKPESLTPVFEI